MFRRIKNLFTHTIRYPLSINAIERKHNDLGCSIYDRSSVHEFKISATEIFNNDSIMAQINIRPLLKLKELHLDIQKEYVTLREILSNNKYKIQHHDHEFMIDGQDACKDMDLLGAMPIRDSFKIIYNTAYRSSLKNQEKRMALYEALSKQTRKQNVLYLKNTNTE